MGIARLIALHDRASPWPAGEARQHELRRVI
jgi:hypothetical protein